MQPSIALQDDQQSSYGPFSAKVLLKSQKRNES